MMAMTYLDKQLKRIHESCKQDGLRLTENRENVLRCLIESKKALSAYELIDLYKVNYCREISAMSIYRILAFLEQVNLAHKIKTTHKYVACSDMTCRHDHSARKFLICDRCEKVREVHIDPDLLAALSDSMIPMGFHLLGPHLEISCICDECHSNS